MAEQEYIDWTGEVLDITRHHAYHYVENQGKLIMQSQENGEKPQFGQFFDDFDVKYLQIANFSEK